MDNLGYGMADAAGRAEIDRLNALAREAHQDFNYTERRRYLDAADKIRTGRQ
jgi:hypothetical protein